MNLTEGLDLRGTLGAAEFERELVDEHLDECEFLLAQRENYLRDPDLLWIDVEAVDRRLLGHLAALCEYDDLALAVSESQAVMQGEWFAAGVLTLGSIPGRRAQRAIIEALGTAPDAMLTLAVQALKVATQPREALLELLDSPSPQLRVAAVQILAHRREPVLPFLPRLLDDESPAVRGEAALALVKLGQRQAVLTRESALLGDRDALTEPALLALLCARSRWAEQICRDLCRPEQERVGSFLRLLALLGREQDVTLIATLSGHQATAATALLALGEHGSLAAVPVLLSALRAADPAQQQAAAASLRLITGEAPQRSVTVWEGESDDPVELRHPRIKQELSTDELEWRQRWPSGHGRRLSSGRYLLGRPHSAAGYLALLAEPGTGYELRRHASWLLLLHSERDSDFEPDWLYSRQQLALERLRTTIGSAE